VVERQTEVVERRSGPFRLNLTTDLAPACVALGITSTQQNFGHLVEALYEAHCVTAQTADSANFSSVTMLLK